jgi:serine/threonine-protein kinase
LLKASWGAAYASRVGEASPQVLQPGATFGQRYEVVRCLSSGGMGAVYEVVHNETRRRRALKVMLPSLVADAELRARFRLEATITADVESNHIVETFDAGVDAETGAPFLVMELLKGEDLGSILEARGALPPAEVVLLLHQAALALDKTHAAGIVHRDLKPENLFVTYRDDGSPCLKILDFGIAKVVAQNVTNAKATRSMGTPLYMSPEQVTGDGAIGPRSDVYALGHIAYALLVGVAYWETELEKGGGVYPLLMRIGTGIPEPASTRAAGRARLSAGFDAWFARAAATRASDRFATAPEAVTGLALARSAWRSPGRPRRARIAAARRSRRRKSTRRSSRAARRSRTARATRWTCTPAPRAATRRTRASRATRPPWPGPSARRCSAASRSRS